MGADNFLYNREHLWAHFKNVCRLMIHCCNLIKENEIIDFSEIHGNEKPENHIRNILLDEKYLWNRFLRSEYHIKDYSFDAESGEINAYYKTIGFHDIKVIGLKNKDSETEKGLHFTFECKRLNKGNQTVTKYNNEGIQRFRDGVYASKMPIAGMIAFVEEGKPTCFVADLNKKLNEEEKLETFSFTKEFTDSYKSQHNRTVNKLELYHLLFDFSDIIRN